MTPPTSTVLGDFFRRTATIETGARETPFADAFASLSAALLCALVLCPLTHLKSTRLPTPLTRLTNSFHCSALMTGVPARVYHFSFGQTNFALLTLSTT